MASVPKVPHGPRWLLHSSHHTHIPGRKANLPFPLGVSSLKPYTTISFTFLWLKCSSLNRRSHKAGWEVSFFSWRQSIQLEIKTLPDLRGKKKRLGIRRQIEQLLLLLGNYVALRWRTGRLILLSQGGHKPCHPRYWIFGNLITFYKLSLVWRGRICKHSRILILFQMLHKCSLSSSVTASSLNVLALSKQEFNRMPPFWPAHCLDRSPSLAKSSQLELRAWIDSEVENEKEGGTCIRPISD